MKKPIIAAICVLAGVGILAGGLMVFQKVNADKNTAAVYPVSSVSHENWWGTDTMSSYGYVTTDVSQNVYINETKLVDEIFVEEGDIVKIGDPLMSYDMTLNDIELEIQKLDLEMVKLQLEAAKRDLEKLNKQKAIAAAADKSINENSAMVAEPVDEPDSGEQRDSEENPTTSDPGNNGEDPDPNPGDPDPDPNQSDSNEPGTDEPNPDQTDPNEPGTDEPDPDETDPPEEDYELFEDLDYKSKPHQGEGTAKDPYVFHCVDKVVIKGEFFNRMKGYDASGTKELHEDGFYFVIRLYDMSGDEPEFIVDWKVKPAQLEIMEPLKEYVLDSETIMYEKPDDDLGDFGDFDFGGGDYGMSDGYSSSELATMKMEKKQAITRYELDIREAELKIAKLEKKSNEQIEKSTINGIVKKVGDPEVGAEQDGSPFLIVTSDKGYYVKGSISELYLDDVKEGTLVEGYSWESGVSFNAVITEISEYPDLNAYSYGNGNNNTTQYPFVAYIDDPGALNNNEYVDLTLTVEGEEMDSASLFMIESYFIRNDNGQSYVYVADEADRLKKQYIKTGKVMYGSVEIKSGLSAEDRIAFPYGKTVKEGVKVKDAEINELYGW